MEHEPGVFDVINDQSEADADAEGIADADAGRVISNEAMKKWLASWGTGKRLAPPQIGD
jgi:predicted transcriptional regulator